MPPMQIIGFGNLERGDDAAGLLVAHRLRDLGVPARDTTADLLGLMTDWRLDQPLLLVDAVISDRAASQPDGLILHFRPADLPRFGKAFRFSTHGLGIPELIGMASALGRLPPEAAVLGITGSHFGGGDRTSREVLSAVELLAAEVATVWRDPDARAWNQLCPPPRTFAEEDAPGP